MSARIRRNRILIVDDEENIRKSLKMILEYEGYTIYEAGDGVEARQRLDEHPEIDLVLLDIKLPDIDGLALLAEIKKRPLAPEVIMISGHGTIPMAVEATKLGAFDFLEKPLHRDRIILSLNHALESRDLRSAFQEIKKKAEKDTRLLANIPP